MNSRSFQNNTENSDVKAAISMYMNAVGLYTRFPVMNAGVQKRIVIERTER